MVTLQKCYCINLKERDDRWKSTVAEFDKIRKYLPNAELVRVDAIKDSDNPKWGLSQTISGIVKMAQDREDPWVCMMEDDCEFLDAGKLMKALENPPKDWDVLSGGSYYTQKYTKIDEHWAETSTFCSTHFIIVRKSVYSLFLNPTSQCNEINHIDRWLNKVANEGKCKYYLVMPMPVRQFAGFSNLRKKIVNDNVIKGLTWCDTVSQ